MGFLCDLLEEGFIIDTFLKILFYRDSIIINYNRK